MSKKHIKNFQVDQSSQFDSISLGDQVFVENPEDSYGDNSAKFVSKSQATHKFNSLELKERSQFSTDWLLKFLLVFFSSIGIAFILFSMNSGLLYQSEMVLQPLGREMLLALAIFAITIFVSIPVVFSKKKIKLAVDDHFLHIKSFRGINHRIPIEQVRDCKVNLFKKVNDPLHQLLDLSAKRNRYSVDLEAGILVLLKNGQNLLIASSNSYPLARTLVYH